MFAAKTHATAEPTVIGDGVVIEGSIRVDGSIRVNGHIEGILIVEGEASIGPRGEILGDIFAGDLTVGGRLEGNVSVRDLLHVAGGGNLLGDVRYGSLQVDRGGVLTGRTIPGEDTISIEAEDGD